MIRNIGYRLRLTEAHVAQSNVWTIHASTVTILTSASCAAEIPNGFTAAN